MDDTTDDTMNPLQRLSKDLKTAARTLTNSEARYLVDTYYQRQDERIRSGNQIRSTLKGNQDAEEPHAVLQWFNDQAQLMEKQIARALDSYTDAHVVGRWSREIYGIGPIIAAGLLAHIDIKHAKTAGAIWRFAGLDPTSIWNKGEKRPFNARLKVICWKAGESFVKTSNRDGDFYGKIYVQRKSEEHARNVDGLLAQRATEKLEKFKIGKDTDAILWYEGHLTSDAVRQYFETPSEKRMGLAKKLATGKDSGLRMLPPDHIHARAKRYAVKLFLSHWHKVAYRAHYGEEAPKPYILTVEGGHAHMIECPDYPF